MGELLHRDCSVISKHIKNEFEEGELSREGSVHILHIANSDKPVEFYNLGGGGNIYPVFKKVQNKIHYAFNVQTVAQTRMIYR